MLYSIGGVCRNENSAIVTEGMWGGGAGGDAGSGGVQ